MYLSCALPVAMKKKSSCDSLFAGRCYMNRPYNECFQLIPWAWRPAETGYILWCQYIGYMNAMRQKVLALWFTESPTNNEVHEVCCGAACWVSFSSLRTECKSVKRFIMWLISLFLLKKKKKKMFLLCHVSVWLQCFHKRTCYSFIRVKKAFVSAGLLFDVHFACCQPQ